MSQPDKRHDMMRHFPTILDRWKGADARLWTLTSGHPTLTILLSRREESRFLLIHCASPLRINAPQHWTPSDIRVELDVDMFRVVDENAGVCISDCGVGLHETTVPPWETAP